MRTTRLTQEEVSRYNAIPDAWHEFDILRKLDDEPALTETDKDVLLRYEEDIKNGWKVKQ